MPEKRKSSNAELQHNKQLKSSMHQLDADITSSYTGFTVPEDGLEIETVDIADISPETFYAEYVSKRKPVKINGVIPGLDIAQFHPESIVKFLGPQHELLVEKKVAGGFGSGEKRIKMEFGEFMDKINSGENDLYLTTQYMEDDPDVQAEAELLQQLADEDSEQEDGLFPDADFSDAGSFNGDMTRDDFDEEDMEEEADDSQADSSDDEEPVVAEDLKDGPLYVSEAEKRVSELLQSPLTGLVDKIPIVPEMLSSLIPQQINLWIGSAKGSSKKTEFELDPKAADLGLGRALPNSEGTSSGLHHDHADNIYIPISGHKRFTIFSPSDTAKMYTVGDVNKVYNSGLIDYNYRGWRHLRADGAIITEVAKYRLDNDESLSKKEQAKLQKLIEDEETLMEEEIVLNARKDPPSFSTVPTAIVHPEGISEKIIEAARAKWPLFFKAKRMTVELKPGEMLYLPTGWFHEVSSFGDVHVAMNYWFIPPDGSDFKKPYLDSYWPEDYERTQLSLKYAAEYA